MKANATNTLHTIATAAHPWLTPSLPTPPIHLTDLSRPPTWQPSRPGRPIAQLLAPGRRHTCPGPNTLRRCRPYLRPVRLSSRHARLQSEFH